MILSGRFAAMTKQRPEALLTLDDPLIFQYQVSIVDFAARSGSSDACIQGIC